MKLKELMSTDVQTLSPDDNLIQAAQLMQEYNVGSIPICNQDKLLGVVTDRDIVIRSLSKGDNPTSTNVGSIMTTGLKSGTPEMEVHEAAEIMAAGQIRRLPVVDNGSIVGIVSLGDLAVESKLVDNAGDALSSISKSR